MTEEELKKTEKELNEERGKNALWSMVREFYTDSPLSVVILTLGWSAIFLAGAIYTGVKFFRVEQVHQQIMYATGFICFVLGIVLMKIFSWELMNRNRIERDIRHLELRVTHWSDLLKK